MKNSKLITLIITGALVATTTVTAFAAQNETRRFITMDDTTGQNRSIFFTENKDGELPEDERPELPEGINTNGERPELPEGERPELPEGITDGERPELPEGERPELPEGLTTDSERPELPESFTNGDRPDGDRLQGMIQKFIPKLKPETKPEGDDMVPPEFEGVENIETLGRPELPEGGEFDPNGQFGNGAPMGQQFGNETPMDMNGGQQFGNEAPMDMTGGQQFGNEMPMGQQFGSEAPNGEFAPDGQSAPDQQFGNEAPMDMNGGQQAPMGMMF